MQKHLANYFRLIAISAVALGLAACAPLAHSGMASLRPEPRVGDAPGTGALPANAAPATEAERLAQLEGQVSALEAELTHLRHALDVMGPLPEHPQFFIPVLQSEIFEEPSDISRLYAAAPALQNGASLFSHAELGSFAAHVATGAGWSQTGAANLNAAYATAAAQANLASGPLAVDADVDALCVELAAIAGPCHGVAPLRAY